MIWNLKYLKMSLTLLSLTALPILSTNYMYILLKLKPGSLPLVIELHQPGIHLVPCTKKAPSINQFKSLLEKDPNLLVNFFDYDEQCNRKIEAHISRPKLKQ